MAKKRAKEKRKRKIKRNIGFDGSKREIVLSSSVTIF